MAGHRLWRAYLYIYNQNRGIFIRSGVMYSMYFSYKLKILITPQITMILVWKWKFRGTISGSTRTQSCPWSIIPDCHSWSHDHYRRQYPDSGVANSSDISNNRPHCGSKSCFINSKKTKSVHSVEKCEKLWSETRSKQDHFTCIVYVLNSGKITGNTITVNKSDWFGKLTAYYPSINKSSFKARVTTQRYRDRIQSNSSSISNWSFIQFELLS